MRFFRQVFAMPFFLGSLIATSESNGETTECTEITSLPVIITNQGVYCLKGNLATPLTTGNAIDIQTNNVTIDLNGFKLGGLGAGLATVANGINATDRFNIKIRNGSIRGFYRGITLNESTGSGSGHLVEGIIADGNRYIGIHLEGDNLIVRDNRVINTGDGSASDNAYGIYVENAVGVQVIGNTIGKITETIGAWGIVFDSVNSGKIADNGVFDISANFEYGIIVENSTNAVITDNRVMNPNAGNIGIRAQNSSGIDCVRNVVRGYATGQATCDTLTDNLIN